MQVPIGASLGCLSNFPACVLSRGCNYNVYRDLGSKRWCHWRAGFNIPSYKIFPRKIRRTRFEALQWSRLKKRHGVPGSSNESQSAGLRTSASTSKTLTQSGPTPDYHIQQENNILHQGIHVEQPRIRSEGITGRISRIHLYDHCAHLNTIPLCELTIHPFETKENMYRFSISCPAQNIASTRSASSPELAENLACIDFKISIEKWKAENTEGASLVKAQPPLNTNIAKRFLNFCRARNPSFFFSHISRKLIIPSHGLKVSWHSCQEYFNGEPVGQVVLMRNKKDAEKVARMTAAVLLKNKYPGLYLEFIGTLESGQYDIGSPIKPIVVKIGTGCLSIISEVTKQIEHIGFGSKPRKKDKVLDKQRDPSNSAVLERGEIKLNARQLQWKSKELLKTFNLYCQDEGLSFLKNKRSELPICQNRHHIINLTEKHPVFIVVGSAGSGKSTQLPQILLENAILENKGAVCNIICTQPRRIAAKSVAERVAFERNEKLQETVGYQVRFDAKLPQPGGSILYCTAGVLLQRLQHDGEAALDDVSHIILDEVHERDITLDFLLIVLKERLLASLQDDTRKPMFKLILMSATANTEMLASYFGKSTHAGSVVPCPVLDVPGRMYPVESVYLEDILEQLSSKYFLKGFNKLMDTESTKFLETERKFQSLATPDVSNLDSDNCSYSQEMLKQNKEELGLNREKVISVPVGLMVATIAYIATTTSEGAILAFLPGLQEIQDVREKLLRLRPFGVDFSNGEKYNIQMLHSSLKEQQMEVFKILDPGCRKIILATSIAETSVTIPDIQYVIDSGLVRSKHYEQIRGLPGLRCSWISKSSCKQRAGRAGRVQNGYYYSLFSKLRYESFRPMAVPEIVHSDLQEICLDIKARDIRRPVTDFLAEAIEPPSQLSVEAALRRLMVLGAIDQQENITPLGKILAALPVAPSLGKMIFLGAICRCLDPMLLLAAASSSSEVFLADSTRYGDSSQARMKFSQGTQSDHIAIINACREWRDVRELEGENAASAFASAMSLHHGALRLTEQAANQIETILVDLGVIPYLNKNERFNGEIGHPKLNENSASTDMMRALILVGFSRNIAVSSGGRGLRTLSEKYTTIHPSSVNCHLSHNKAYALPYGHLFAYSEKERSNDKSSVFLRHTTKINPLDVVMFGGHQKACAHLLMFDDWLPLYGMNRTTHDTAQALNYTLNTLLDNIFEDISKDSRGISLLDDNSPCATLRNGITAILEAASGSKPQWELKTPNLRTRTR